MNLFVVNQMGARDDVLQRVHVNPQGSAGGKRAAAWSVGLQQTEGRPRLTVTRSLGLLYRPLHAVLYEIVFVSQQNFI